MQLVKMLNGKELSMKREVFAKNAHFIGGVPEAKVEDFEPEYGWVLAGMWSDGQKETVSISGSFQK